ncbi:type II toxin-antitoxin system RelE/ParE family toxin [Tabrizicola sp. TH137]|uniref:type II toxin-antitoxin system RelE/ParE family toxin n=1 Tax=Tabrizicola sp. TH137 TaxID=2067452 RepID=UPI0013047607|nr:type II toxin-antitoxin system RelE/ParE family toxin [Tabrizicola sp. TH137]
MEQRFLISARNDLAALRDHYRRTLPPGLRHGQKHLSEALNRLADNPEAGIPLPSPQGLRALALPIIPFVLIYRIRGSRIEFLRLCGMGQAGRP